MFVKWSSKATLGTLTNDIHANMHNDSTSIEWWENIGKINSFYPVPIFGFRIASPSLVTRQLALTSQIDLRYIHGRHNVVPLPMDGYFMGPGQISFWTMMLLMLVYNKKKQGQECSEENQRWTWQYYNHDDQFSLTSWHMYFVHVMCWCYLFGLFLSIIYNLKGNAN